MKYEVRILRRAREDIQRNAAWWADHHSVQQAERWIDAVRDQILTLDEMPERCAVSAENDDFSVEIRDLLIGLGSRPSYRAVFTIVGNIVYVAAIRRAAEDRLDPAIVTFDPQE